MTLNKLDTRGKEKRYKAWLDKIKDWSGRFHITPEQAVSIMYNENLIADKDNKMSDILGWHEGNEFADIFIAHSYIHGIAIDIIDKK